MFTDSSILITGGTGSFGKAFVKTVLDRSSQNQATGHLSVATNSNSSRWRRSSTRPSIPDLRYFIGDVRDYNRLKRALEGIDTVIHAAALKQVPAAEYNPFEFIKTNILGAQNLIDACLDMRRQAGRRPLHRQGRRAHQSLRRHQALFRQAVHRRQQYPRPARYPFCRGALRQRHGQSRLRRSPSFSRVARPAFYPSPTPR